MKTTMPNVSELEVMAFNAARKVYLYDSSYPDEHQEAVSEWNKLLPSLKEAGIDWKIFLPHRNCEGEFIW